MKLLPEAFAPAMTTALQSSLARWNVALSGALEPTKYRVAMMHSMTVLIDCMIVLLER
jgi:hypothetical protein